jgi:3-deoxy-manno-octulosonate cytidylyltransferase (CMP-KDO synthetase)
MLTSSMHQSGTDRCAEVLEHYKDCDVLINIQGDEPLVAAEQLDQLLAAFQDREVQIATLVHANVTPSDLQNVNRIKVLADHAQNALYFSRSPLPNMHYAKKDKFPWLRHIGLYAYRTKTLQQISKLKSSELEQAESLEQLRWLYYGFPIRLVQTHIETPNIDVPDDIEKVLPFL